MAIIASIKIIEGLRIMPSAGGAACGHALRGAFGIARTVINEVSISSAIFGMLAIDRAFVTVNLAEKSRATASSRRARLREWAVVVALVN